MAANYRQRTLTEETYNFKKHYDSNIYVVFAEQHFNLTLNSTIKKFIIFIKQKGEQFGDALPATLVTPPIIRVYDNSGGIMLNSIALTQTDSYLGEWQYTFAINDFNKTGLYEGEVIIPGTSESVIGKFKINVS
ncbi:MAG: hypothetical protein ABIP51_03160 [Bacteroidia bacterium]